MSDDLKPDILYPLDPCWNSKGGSPAFPISFEHRLEPGEPTKSMEWFGMTLREWYIGMALQGVIAKKLFKIPYEDIANEAVSCVDAVLAKLEKEKHG